MFRIVVQVLRVPEPPARAFAGPVDELIVVIQQVIRNLAHLLDAAIALRVIVLGHVFPVRVEREVMSVDFVARRVALPVHLAVGRETPLSVFLLSFLKRDDAARDESRRARRVLQHVQRVHALLCGRFRRGILRGAEAERHGGHMIGCPQTVVVVVADRVCRGMLGIIEIAFGHQPEPPVPLVDAVLDDPRLLRQCCLHECDAADARRASRNTACRPVRRPRPARGRPASIVVPRDRTTGDPWPRVGNARRRCDVPIHSWSSLSTASAVMSSTGRPSRPRMCRHWPRGDRTLSPSGVPTHKFPCESAASAVIRVASGPSVPYCSCLATGVPGSVGVVQPAGVAYHVVSPMRAHAVTCQSGRTRFRRRRLAAESLAIGRRCRTERATGLRDHDQVHRTRRSATT